MRSKVPLPANAKGILRKQFLKLSFASVYLWVWDLGEEGERVESLGGGVPHHEAPLLVLALQHRLRPLPRHVRHVPDQ